MRITHEKLPPTPILNGNDPNLRLATLDSDRPCSIYLGSHAGRLIIPYPVMHFRTSCTAPLELPRCGISHYIHFNDEASFKS